MFKRIDYLTIKIDDAAGAAQVWEATLGLKARAPQSMAAHFQPDSPSPSN